MTKEQFFEACRQAEESNRLAHELAAKVLAGCARNLEQRYSLTINKPQPFIDILAITREASRS